MWRCFRWQVVGDEKIYIVDFGKLMNFVILR